MILSIIYVFGIQMVHFILYFIHILLIFDNNIFYLSKLNHYLWTQKKKNCFNILLVLNFMIMVIIIFR